MNSTILSCFLALFILNSCQTKTPEVSSVGDNGSKKQATQIAEGSMPSVTVSNQVVHVVYGNGDSILYISSTNKGQSFSTPVLVGHLPKLAASHTRGPQIAISNEGLIVTACTTMGDIYSYNKITNENWSGPERVNDVDTVAKENLMGLSADGSNAFAVWLDLRGNKQNKIYGAKSTDGGKTWLANSMIYTSPDTTVCECCKPSVLVKDENVYVMFRNWIDGNRDMYLIQSNNGGKSFNEAEKLGTGNWKLDGCPMDGGGITVSEEGWVQTVWRRQGKLFMAEPGKREKEIGDGKGATIASVNGQNVYAWSEKGNIICLLPTGEKQDLGKGSLPVIKTIDNKTAICIWDNKTTIHGTIINL